MGASVGRGRESDGRGGSVEGRPAALTSVRRRLLTSALLAALLIARGPALARAGAPDPVSGRLRAGGAEAVIEVTVAPGWHINAHTPRDEFLIATTLELVPPPGQKVAEVAWPQPVERTLAFAP